MFVNTKIRKRRVALSEYENKKNQRSVMIHKWKVKEERVVEDVEEEEKCDDTQVESERGVEDVEEERKCTPLRRFATAFI